LHGVTLYREIERAFSQGDRVKFTAPNREQHIANRDLGTIEKIGESGKLQVLLDSGREVAFNIKENPHLDYGYAVTSRSSQGQTADRVLVHVDTEQAGDAYVAVSRGRYDAQVYTNDKNHLTEQLPRDVSHRSAIEPSRESAPSDRRSRRHPRGDKYRNTYSKWVTASADRPGFPPLPPLATRLPTVTLDRGFASGFLLSHERHGPLCAQLATGR
jgi:hypothetical protein